MSEETIEGVKVLFKAAGERWGNEDNLWLRYNDLVENLFLGQGKVDSDTLIFPAQGKGWALVTGTRLFSGVVRKSAICKDFSIFKVEENSQLSVVAKELISGNEKVMFKLGGATFDSSKIVNSGWRGGEKTGDLAKYLNSLS